MSTLNEQLTKVMKREYVELRAKKVKPADAKSLLSKKYYISEATVHQRLFDKKYGKRTANHSHTKV